MAKPSLDELLGTTSKPSLDELLGSDPVPQAATNEQQAAMMPSSRLMHGVADAGYGIAQLAPRAISGVTSLFGTMPNKVSEFYDQDAARMDAQAAQRATEYEAAKQATGQTGIDAMRLMGNVTSPATGLIGKGAAMLPQATSFLGNLAQNAAIGGVFGATQPVENTDAPFASQKLGQIGTGAATAGILQTGGGALASAVKPNVSPNVKKLLDEGIRLTPGQIRGGWAQRVEDKLTSVPLLGDAIKTAQRRGYEDMNRAVANRALAPIGQSVPKNLPAGRDMVSHVEDTLGAKYEEILSQMTGTVDDQFLADISRTLSKSKTLPASQQKTLKQLIVDQFGNKPKTLTGKQLKGINSTLSRESAGYKADPSYDNRKLGGAIGDLKTAMNNMLRRNNAPELSQQLSKTDEGWANYVRMRKAAGSLGAKEGVFTPAQLQSAVKSSEKSVGQGRFAKGDNLMQDLSDPAVAVLPSTIPDSGTAGRSFMGLLGLGASGFVSPVAASGGLAATGLYTRPGVAVLETLLAKRPDLAEPVAQAIRMGTSPTDILHALMK